MNRDKHFSLDGFMLAMCEWQLGHEAESRKWLAASRHWMKRFAPDDIPLADLRREASALITAIEQVPSASDETTDDGDDEIALYSEILDADREARWTLLERAQRYLAKRNRVAAAADLHQAAALPGAASDDCGRWPPAFNRWNAGRMPSPRSSSSSISIP